MSNTKKPQQTTIWEIIQTQHPGLLKFHRERLENLKMDFQKKLAWRIEEAEKRVFLEEEIKLCRDYLERNDNHELYNYSHGVMDLSNLEQSYSNITGHYTFNTLGKVPQDSSIDPNTGNNSKLNSLTEEGIRTGDTQKIADGIFAFLTEASGQDVKASKTVAETASQIIELHSIEEYLNFLIDLYRQFSENTNKSKLRWKQENETEFVQFVYSLFEANIIEHEEKEIVKLVEDFARFLNFPLGKNWQVNLSTSIHKRNSDYVPPIFDKLKEAYLKLQRRKIEKKKKN